MDADVPIDSGRSGHHQAGVSQYGSTRSLRPLQSIHRGGGCVYLSMSVQPPSDGEAPPIGSHLV
jgi:hypothetical protein